MNGQLSNKEAEQYAEACLFCFFYFIADRMRSTAPSST